MKNKINISMLTSHSTIFIILITFFSVLGSTYAYFFMTKSDNTTITGDAATVNLTLDVNLVLPTKTNTGVIVPQKSTSGDTNSPLSSALKSSSAERYLSSGFMDRHFFIILSSFLFSQSFIDGCSPVMSTFRRMASE